MWLGTRGRTGRAAPQVGRAAPPARRGRAHLPAGELEGWNTTFVNLFASVYRTILGCPVPGDERVATLADGLFLMRLIAAVTRSSAERAWVNVAADGAYATPLHRQEKR